MNTFMHVSLVPPSTPSRWVCDPVYRWEAEAWLWLRFCPMRRAPAARAPHTEGAWNRGLGAGKEIEATLRQAFCGPVFPFPALTLSVIHSSWDIFVLLQWEKKCRWDFQGLFHLHGAAE